MMIRLMNSFVMRSYHHRSPPLVLVLAVHEETFGCSLIASSQHRGILATTRTSRLRPTILGPEFTEPFVRGFRRCKRVLPVQFLSLHVLDLLVQSGDLPLEMLQ